MDRFRTDVAAYVKSSGEGPNRILAPMDFRESFSLAGDYEEPVAAADTDTVILHKTDFRQLPLAFVRDVLKDMNVAFANEVFLVFTRQPARVKADSNHLGALRDLQIWVEKGETDGGSEALARPSTPRMAPVYVGNDRVLIQSAYGHLMLVTGQDTSITPHLIRDGYFDLNLTRFLLRTLKRGQAFIDVGANFGTYTLLAAGAVGPKGRVLAVEASPQIAEILHENVVMNGFEPFVRVCRVAASDTEGVAVIHLHSIRQGGSTMVSAVAQRAAKQYGERVVHAEVECRTLDGLASDAGFTSVDLVKIDVEGFEAAVLRGGRQTILRHRPKLLLEWHPSFMTAESVSEISEFLIGDGGYKLRRIEQDGDTREIDLQELTQLEHSDVLAVPATL